MLMASLRLQGSKNATGSALTVDCDGNMTIGSDDTITESIIMKDLETGLKYKVVIRNGEICIEGCDTQSKREVTINKILK